MGIDEPYQQIILDHAKRPCNYGELSDTRHVARGENPVCGDEVAVFLKLSPEKKRLNKRLLQDMDALLVKRLLLY